MYKKINYYVIGSNAVRGKKISSNNYLQKSLKAASYQTAERTCHARTRKAALEGL